MTSPSPYGAGPGLEPVCPRHPDRVAYVRCQRCERPVCPECQRPAAVGVQCVDCVREQAKSMPRTRTVFGGRASTDERPLVTQSIIAICVAVFAVQHLGGTRITTELSFFPPEAVAQPYRFLTVAFLHSPTSLLHIAFNLYALWIVGPYLERLLGRLQFAVLYLLAAVGGSVGSYLLVDPYSEAWFARAWGASGAVFGLFGAFVVLNRRLGRDTTAVVGVMVVNGVIGFLPGLDIGWQAHLGGLVVGVLTAAAIAYLPRERVRLRWAAFAAVAVLLVVLVALRTQGLPAGAVVPGPLSTLWTGGVDNTSVIPQL